jgi:hypothetical protein
MMIKAGDGPLDKNEFDFLLRSILLLGEKKGTATERELARRIRAAAVIVEFALAGYDRAGNEFAKIESYVLFACYLRAVGMRYRLRSEILEPTIKLMENAIDECARNLWHEAKKTDAFGQGGHLTEPIVGPYRDTILYGALAAHGLWCMMGGKSSWYEKEREDLAKEMVKKGTKVLLASEAFVPAKFLISEFLRHNGHVREGNKMFSELLSESVFRKLSDRAQRPLWDPYMSLEEAVLRDLGKPHDVFLPRTWQRNSYTCYALILVAASRLLRQDLESLWYPITSLVFQEFVPVREYQILLWQNQTGTTVQKMVPRPSSWGKLCKEARDTTNMPRAFVQMQHWLPYFLLVYPHRFAACRVLPLVEGVRRGSVQPV